MKPPLSKIRSKLDEARSAHSDESKQRHLLALGEQLITHLASFILAEYRDTGLTFLKLEKDLISRNKNLSVGIYIGWIRETARFLKEQKKPSIADGLITVDSEMPEATQFISRLGVFKKQLESTNLPPLYDTCIQLVKGHSKKNCSLNELFDAFVQLRNKVAHPVYEVKGKLHTWPFNDDYYRFFLPVLETALANTVDALTPVWSYESYLVAENADGGAVLTDAEGGDMVSINGSTEWQEGMSLLRSAEGRILVNDWKALFKPHPAAEEAIRQEQEQLRKIGTIAELKEHIKHFLEDGQIAVEEFRLLESIARSKLNMPEEELRGLVIASASEMGIESPFPEVDLRFVETVDRAIRSRSYNPLVLRLLGEQFGVETADLEELVDARAALLGISPEEARQSDITQFSNAELEHFQSLVVARQWLMAMLKLNTGSSENYKLTGQASEKGTKEFWHKHAFKSVEGFVKHRLALLGSEHGEEWQIQMNQWQIGNMTSYAWCSFYPKNTITQSALALHLSLYGSGNAAIGFLPDWKALGTVAHYGKLLYHTRKGLQRYFTKYLQEFKKYKDLVVWNHIVDGAFSNVAAIMEKYPWYIQTDYQFEQIQFLQSLDQALDSPARINEYFDISYNLFNSLLPEIEQDYATSLTDGRDPLLMHADVFGHLIESVHQLLLKHVDDPSALGIQGDLTKYRPGLRLSVKEEGYAMQLAVCFSADYSEGLMHCDFIIRYAHERTPLHQRLGALLEQFEPPLEGFKRLERPGALLFRYSTTAAESLHASVTEAFGTFVSELTLSLSRMSIKVMGLKPVLPDMNDMLEEAHSALDSLQVLVQPMMANGVKKERDFRSGLRIIDYVDSTRKHGVHWMGYGMRYLTGDRYEWVLMAHLNNVMQGPVLADLLERYAQQHPDFVLEYGGSEPLRSDAVWRMESVSEPQITASSQYNRNHGAKYARLHAEPKFANWSAATCKAGEWIQVDLGEQQDVWCVAVQGRHNRDQWITRFDVLVSGNGKDWITVRQHVAGPSTRNEPVLVDLDRPVAAKFVRIVVQEWHGWVSMRFDVCSSPSLPRNIRITRSWSYPQTPKEEFKKRLLETLEQMRQELGKEFLFK